MFKQNPRQEAGLTQKAVLADFRRQKCPYVIILSVVQFLPSPLPKAWSCNFFLLFLLFFVSTYFVFESIAVPLRRRSSFNYYILFLPLFFLLSSSTFAPHFGRKKAKVRSQTQSARHFKSVE